MHRFIKYFILNEKGWIKEDYKLWDSIKTTLLLERLVSTMKFGNIDTNNYA